MTTNNCVVVGSGINALVCAAILATRGKKVCVLERNNRLGGCIRTEELTVPGFTHDVLSGWHPLFVSSPGYAILKDQLEKYGLQYCNNDTPTAAVLPDDRSFILRRSREENIRAMEALAAGDGERYRAAMGELEASLDLTFTLLGSELWTPATVKVFMRALWKMGPRALADYFGQNLQNARGWLETTFQAEEARAVLAGWPTHAGLGPDSTASAQMAKVMAFSMEAVGCPNVKGGSYQLVEAFRQLIEANGGILQVGADVERVLTEGGKAVGVRTADGVTHYADTAVICSTTPNQLYERLLAPADVSEKVLREVRSFKYGKADMQIHLALDEIPEWSDPELAKVAIVHLTEGVNAVSKATNEAERGLLPELATVVVGQPTAIDPSRAPEGKAILWLQLQELPSLIKGDAANEIDVPADGKWTEEVRELYADRIVARVAKHVKNLDGNILGRRVLSPADLESININLVGGDPYSGACTMDQFFLWRPLRSVKNHSTPVRDLFHIGASTHPGPGLGGVSGFLVANALT